MIKELLLLLLLLLGMAKVKIFRLNSLLLLLLPPGVAKEKCLGRRETSVTKVTNKNANHVTLARLWLHTMAEPSPRDVGYQDLPRGDGGSVGNPQGVYHRCVCVSFSVWCPSALHAPEPCVRSPLDARSVRRPEQMEHFGSFSNGYRVPPAPDNCMFLSLMRCMASPPKGNVLWT